MLKVILDIVIAGILTGGLYALVAAGFNMQYGVARILNVAHGEFIMVGAMITYYIFTLFNINPFIALVVCGVGLFVLAILLHNSVFQRLRVSAETIQAFEGSSLLAGFGMLFFIQNVAVLLAGSLERGYSFLASSVNLGGAIFEANRLVTCIVAILLGILFYVFIQRTRIGKAIRAVTQDAIGAKLMGINTGRMQALCFGLGASLAGFAGVLLSMTVAITPFIGLQYTVIAMIVVVLGGLGNILGSMVGGLILGIVGSIALYFHAGAAEIVYYVIFIVLIIIRPEGLFSRR